MFALARHILRRTRQQRRPQAAGRLRSTTQLAAAPALLLTVENTLNRIWAVRSGRPITTGVGLACMYYCLPNTKVRRRDAIAGGLTAANLARRWLSAY